MLLGDGRILRVFRLGWTLFFMGGFRALFCAVLGRCSTEERDALAIRRPHGLGCAFWKIRDHPRLTSAEREQSDLRRLRLPLLVLFAATHKRDALAIRRPTRRAIMPSIRQPNWR